VNNWERREDVSTAGFAGRVKNARFDRDGSTSLIDWLSLIGWSSGPADRDQF